MNFSNLFASGAVVVDATPTSQKALFQLIGDIAAREYGLDAGKVVERLTERERLGTTGFGNGIALPHGRLEGLGTILGIVVRLAKPVDFNAVDSLPVDLIVCLLSPVDAGALHLKALAHASRLLRDEASVAKMRGAATGDALLAVFAEHEARDAA